MAKIKGIFSDRIAKYSLSKLEKAPNFVISLKNRLISVEIKARLRYIEVAKTIKYPVLPNKPPFGIIDARKRFRFSRAKLLERRTVMISIRDIAKECGVSVATVSKALNGHHDISAQTRETSPIPRPVRSRRTVHTIWAFCTRTRSTAVWGTNIFRAFWRASARRPRPAATMSPSSTAMSASGARLTWSTAATAAWTAYVWYA